MTNNPDKGEKVGLPADVNSGIAEPYGSSLARRVCPCLSVTTNHMIACFFAGTMFGAVLHGVIGAIVGGCAGLGVGAAAALSKNR